MPPLMNTKEASQYLRINEKKIYTLINDKGLPATKVTGKWLFQRHLLDQWLEQNTENNPGREGSPNYYEKLLIITGSNDLLLDLLIELFVGRHQMPLPVFVNLGSLGGIHMLKEDLCHLCSAHLLEIEEDDYNFAYVEHDFGDSVVVINFSKRLQAILVPPGNPRNVTGLADLATGRLRIANRKEGTGTRLLLDRELEQQNVSGDQIPGYDNTFSRHLDVGHEVLTGRADAGLAIAAVGGLLGLEQVPVRWERYDFIVRKEVFFSNGVQMLLALLHDQEFLSLSKRFIGYDLSMSGQVVFRS